MVLKKWTEKEDKTLLEMYSDTPQKELSDLMERSAESIRKRAQRLGLHKDWGGGPKNLTHKDFINKIKNRLDPSLIFISEYSSRSAKIDMRCINGHKFNIIPASILQSDNIIECKECKGASSSYKFWGDYSNLKEDISHCLSTGMSNTDIANRFDTTLSSIEHVISTVGLAGTVSKFDKVWYRLNEICLDLDYEILSEQVDSSHDKFQFKCNNGHFNELLVKNFLNKGYRCSTCSGSHSSQAEKEIVDIIKNLIPGIWIIEKDRKILGGRELDIVLPDYGLAIEYNGIYWHSSAHVDKSYHYNKTKEVEDFGYQLIHIYEDDWINHKNIIISRLSSILNKVKKIYARTTVVNKVSTKEAEIFFNNNHLQGYTTAKYTYGLYLSGELVSCMSFSTPRFAKDYDYELVRFANKLGFSVLGGASKLLHHFRKEYTGSIISYSNKSWSTGDLYKKLGFTYTHSTSPGYKYYKGLNSLSRYSCQKHKLKVLFPEIYSENKTEEQIMLEAKYLKVYDSGNDVWIRL